MKYCSFHLHFLSSLHSFIYSIPPSILSLTHSSHSSTHLFIFPSSKFFQVSFFFSFLYFSIFLTYYCSPIPSTILSSFPPFFPLSCLPSFVLPSFQHSLPLFSHSFHLFFLFYSSTNPSIQHPFLSFYHSANVSSLPAFIFPFFQHIFPLSFHSLHHSIFLPLKSHP